MNFKRPSLRFLKEAGFSPEVTGWGVVIPIITSAKDDYYYYGLDKDGNGHIYREVRGEFEEVICSWGLRMSSACWDSELGDRIWVRSVLKYSQRISQEWKHFREKQLLQTPIFAQTI